MKFRMGEIIESKIWAIHYSKSQQHFFKKFKNQTSTILYQLLYTFQL